MTLKEKIEKDFMNAKCEYDENYWLCECWFTNKFRVIVRFVIDPEWRKGVRIEIYNYQGGSGSKFLDLHIPYRNWQRTAKAFIIKESIRNWCNSARKSKEELLKLINNV